MQIDTYAAINANIKQNIGALTYINASDGFEEISNLLETYKGAEVLAEEVAPFVNDIVCKEFKKLVIYGLPPGGWNNIN